MRHFLNLFSAEPRNKIALTAIPVSKNWHFGKEDIDELLFMLQEVYISLKWVLMILKVCVFKGFNI